MADVKPKVPDSDRMAEFWAVVKLHLAGKVDTETLTDYSNTDTVIRLITEALQKYPTDTQMTEAITSALVNYMTASEVNEAIAAAVTSSAGLHYEKVDVLPEEGDSNTIYLVPSNREGEDIYDEYYYFDGKWEKIGATGIDLSNYWSKEDLTIMTKAELEEILV